jgi:ferredoxin
VNTAIKIDDEKCNGCGICAEVCPNDAIIVDDVARVVENKCMECGLCVNKCPNGAITLHTATQPIGAPQPGIPQMYNPGIGIRRGGSMDRGRRSGGQGMGMGRGRGTVGSDICTCPNCGYTAPHARGTPCSSMKCPQCGTPMRGRQCY